MQIRFEKAVSNQHRKLMIDGQFKGWVHISTRRPTGFNAQRVTDYECTVDGKSISATSLTTLRARILAA